LICFGNRETGKQEKKNREFIISKRKTKGKQKENKRKTKGKGKP